MATVTNLRPVPNAKRRRVLLGSFDDDVDPHDGPRSAVRDQGLPDLKGEHLATQLKYEPGLEQTRIIAISGLPQQNLEERAREAGCAEFYRKPIDPTKLEEILAEPE